MKKSILRISVLLSLVSVAFYACKKDGDTEAPVITLAGSNPYILLNIGDSYVEPGFSAKDNKDGTITTKVTTTTDLNKDSAGTYQMNYYVTDAAGNSGSASRVVIVQNSLETNTPLYLGIFNVSEVCGGNPGASYKDTTSFSSTINNRIWFKRFANYTNERFMPILAAPQLPFHLKMLFVEQILNPHVLSQDQAL